LKIGVLTLLEPALAETVANDSREKKRGKSMQQMAACLMSASMKLHPTMQNCKLKPFDRTLMDI